MTRPRKEKRVPSKRRRRLGTMLRWSIVLSALLAGTYLLRQPLFGDLVADRVSAALSEALGVPVRVDRVLGSWIADARIEEIRIDTTKATGVLTGLDATSLEVHFDLWKLLAGDVIEGIRSVEAEGLVVSLDFTRTLPPDDPLGQEAEGATIEEVLDVLPTTFPPIDIDGTVTMMTGLGRFVVEDVAITTPEPDVLALDARQIELPGSAGSARGFRARIRREAGRLVWQSDSLIAGVTLSSITAGADGTVSAQGVVAGAPISIELGNGRGRIETGAMQIASVPPWVLRLIDDPLLRPSSGTLEFSATLDSTDLLAASATLIGSDIVLPRQRVARLRIDVRVDDDAIDFTRVTLEADGADIQLAHLVVGLDDPARDVRRLQSAQIRIEDLRDFVEGVDRPLAVVLDAHSPDGQEVRLRNLTVRGVGVQLDGTGSVRLADDGQPLETSALDIAVAGTVRDLRIGDLDLEGALSIDLQIAGAVSAPRLSGRLEGRDVSLYGQRFSEVRLEGRLDEGLLDIETLRIRGTKGVVEGMGRVWLSGPRFEGLSLRLMAVDLAAWRDLLPRDVPAMAGTVDGTLLLNGDPTTLDGRGALTFRDLHVDEWGIGSGTLSFSAEGGVASVDVLEARGAWGSLQAHGQVDLGERHARIDALAGEWGEHPLRLLSPTRVRFGDGLQIEGLDASVLGGRVRGTLSLQPTLAGRLAFEDIDLAPLHDLVPAVPAVVGRASGTLERSELGLQLSLAIPTLTYAGHVGQVDLRLDSTASGTTVKSFEIDAGELLRARATGTLPYRIDRGRLEGVPGATGTFTFEGQTTRARDLAGLPVRAAEVNVRGTGSQWEMDLALRGVAVLEGVDPLESVVGRIRSGPRGLQVEATLENDPRATARLDVTSPTSLDPFAPEDIPRQLDDIGLTGSLIVDVPDAKAIVAFLPDVVQTASGPLHAELGVTGTLPRPDLVGAIRGKGLQLRLRDVPGDVRIPHLLVKVEDGELRIVEAQLGYGSAVLSAAGRMDLPAAYDSGWTRQQLSSEATLDIPELGILNDVLSELAPFEGALEGEVRVTGTVASPEVAGWLRGTEVRMSPSGMTARIHVPSAHLVFSNRTLEIRDLHVAHEGAEARVRGTLIAPDDASFDVETVVADLLFEASLPALQQLGLPLPVGWRLDGSVHASGTAHGTLQAPRLTGRLVAQGLRLTVPGLAQPFQSERLELRLEPRELVLTETRVALGATEATVTARIELPADTRTIRLEELPLEAQLTLRSAALTAARSLWPDLRGLSGMLNADVRATGSLSDPALTGVIELRDAGIALPGSLATLDRLNGTLRFEGRAVTLEGVRGEFGKGPFTLRGRAQWPAGEELSIDMHVSGQRVLLARSDDVRLRANLELDVRGPWSALQAKGELGVTDLVYVASMDLFGGGGPASAGEGLELFRLEGAPLDTMRLDVHVRAPGTIRVDTNILRGTASADFHVRGTGRAPATEGQISFPGLLVKLPFSSLKVDQGVLRFPPGETTDPILRATAHTEMKGYELTVLATGRLPEVSIRVQSVPPLAQNEAILLLTTGATSNELRREGLARAALSRIGSVFGKSLLSGGGRGPDDPDSIGFFDRFEFVQGRQISRAGDETLEVEILLTDRLYLRMERDRYDDFNAGLVWKWRFR